MMKNGKKYEEVVENWGYVELSYNTLYNGWVHLMSEHNNVFGAVIKYRVTVLCCTPIIAKLSPLLSILFTLSPPFRRSIRETSRCLGHKLHVFYKPFSPPSSLYMLAFTERTICHIVQQFFFCCETITRRGV